MAEGVLMPKEGITVESCIIGEWKKNVGDHVNVGDILFSYETDKAEFECESTASGTLLEKFYEDGDEVPCLVNVCAVGRYFSASALHRPLWRLVISASFANSGSVSPSLEKSAMAVRGSSICV